ncbi:MAG: phage tail protein, partial [Clostridiales Family XIII bacterium]|nr:phage tail protein [Clostridiales Family XIII bacterium]
VIEFRQGNAASLAPVKIPGLVMHGYITLKYGFTKDSSFRAWVADCVNERRGAINRQDMIIELIDIIPGAPQTVPTASAGTDMIWTFKNAWVSKYTGPDLNSMTSEVAMESVEIAYEEIVIANVSAGGAGAGA